MKIIFSCFLLSLMTLGSFGQSEIHGLKISANHRYFIENTGKPFLWLGDTGWLLFSKLNREESERYLEDRSRKGFTVVQAMLIHSIENSNAYGDSALVNKDITHPCVTEGNSSLDQNQYDYWDHIDYIIDLAKKKGLYMALVPVWGANVKSGAVTKKAASIYAKWLAERYKDKTNIIWLNGGDIKGTDSIETWRIIGRTLKMYDPNHLVSYHPFGRTSSSEYFHSENWLDFNMYQSGHKSYALDTIKTEHRFGPDNYRFTNIDLNLKPTKPTLDGEPAYELIPDGLHDTTKAYWTANDARRYAYWSVFAGAAGHTYGHNSVMQMHKPSDKGSAYGSKKYWYDALNDEGAAQMIYLKKLILSKSFFDRVPDKALIVGSPGTNYDYISATRGKDYAFIYDFTGRSFKVRMGRIGGVRVNGSWYNPRNGEKKHIGSFENKGIQTFNPPGEPKDGNDWVLILEGV